MNIRIFKILILLILSGCEAGAQSPASTTTAPEFEQIALIKSRALDEISGIVMGMDGDFFVHNDEGKATVHVIDLKGRHVAAIRIRDAKNRDWEDMTSIPGDSGRLLVVGDTGDNKARHKSIRLYFIAEPRRNEQGKYPQEVERIHKLKVRYPDGARDTEAMAYDPSSNMLLFLSKRDSIPRLYGLALEDVLISKESELEFLGEVPTFRAPTAADLLRGGKRAKWGSQPTGMDISSDGKQAAVITYLSLYLWSREDDETWAEAFQKIPREFVGPPGLHEEAVTFGANPNEVFVTTERLPAPLYRLVLP